MKNRHWLNIITPLLVAAFILSMFSGLAAAQTPAEQYEKAREQYQIHKEKYEDAKEKFRNAEEKFKDARLKFKTAKNNQSRTELLNRTRDYLVRAADQMIANLEVLKSRIEDVENRGVIPFNTVDIIDKHITQLEDIKTKVQQASTPQEILDSGRELRDVWIKMSLEVRYSTGILANHRIGMFLEKADNVSARIDETIKNLKDQGKDTSRLENEASDFKSLVADARESYEKVVDLYATHSGFGSDGMVTSNKDAQAFISESSNLQRETLKELKRASEQFRDVFKEIKKLTGGKVVVNGTGKLEANGTGRAVITGNVTVTVSGNATLIVSSNADVTTDGTGTREVLGNGDIKYQGFGEATITGNGIRVDISGSDITLTAEGTGSAVLRGRGTYRTEKEFTASGEWKKEG